MLLALLARSQGVRLTFTGFGVVTPEPTLMELLYKLFIDACRFALRRGAIRSYRRVVEVGPQLRGALTFPQQTLVSLVDPGFFVTTRTELGWDNPFNRVLAAACDRVMRSRREDLRAAAQLLAASLRTTHIPLRLAADREAARRMRLPKEHSLCLRLAELILETAGGAGLFAGDLDLGAEVVSTWRLWQAGIAAMALSTPGVVATAQPAGNYALRLVQGGGARQVLELRPDLLASVPGRGVLDTKWKAIDAGNPVLDSADLHQALDYARHFHVPRVILLYPGFSDAVVNGPFAVWETTSEPKILVSAFQLSLASGIESLEVAVHNAVLFSIAGKAAA